MYFTLKEKVYAKFLEYKLTDHSLLLAMSGGKDSMVLADILLKLNLQFSVAHVNYGFRDQESDGDLQFVTQWCHHNNKLLHTLRLDGKKQMNGDNLQDYARKKRYNFFYKLLSENSYDYIITAHHQNDQAETVLLQLLRGTGLNGLKGMSEIEDKIFRPMLHIPAEEIKKYAGDQSIKWREDRTNNTNDYRRNYLRHEIIPRLENEFPNVVKNISNTSLRLHQAYNIYKSELESIIRKLLITTDNKTYRIAINALKSMNNLQTVIYELGAKFGFNAQQVPEIEKLMTARQGASIVSENFKIIKNNTHLWITCLSDETDIITVSEEDIANNRLLKINDCKLNLTKADINSIDIYDKDALVVDYQKLVFPLILRKVKTGDYFYPLGLNKKKKISKFLIDQKVPLHQRAQCYILQSEQKIAALLSQRIDHRFRITDKTLNCLVINTKD